MVAVCFTEEIPRSVCKDILVSYQGAMVIMERQLAWNV